MTDLVALTDPQLAIQIELHTDLALFGEDSSKQLLPQLTTEVERRLAWAIVQGDGAERVLALMKLGAKVGADLSILALDAA